MNHDNKLFMFLRFFMGKKD